MGKAPPRAGRSVHGAARRLRASLFAWRGMHVVAPSPDALAERSDALLLMAFRPDAVIAAMHAMAYDSGVGASPIVPSVAAPTPMDSDAALHCAALRQTLARFSSRMIRSHWTSWSGMCIRRDHGAMGRSIGNASSSIIAPHGLSRRQPPPPTPTSGAITGRGGRLS